MKRISVQWVWPWALSAWDVSDYGTHVSMTPDPFRLSWWRFRTYRMLDGRSNRTGRYFQALGLEVLFYDA